MKQEFIDFLNALMAAAPEVVADKMTDSVQAYINALMDSKNDKPEVTDNGKMILDWMQKSDMPMVKARDVAEGLFISSRAVSGAMRKLVTDGFVEKVGQDPTIYSLTDNGKTITVE